MLNLPAEHYLNLIKENEPFSLSRFGDGEIIAMFPNGMKANCDGSAFIPELSEPMKQIFRNQYDYYHCFLDCTFCVNGDLFAKFLKDTCPEMKFYYGEFWQELSFNSRIGEIISAISVYKPCFIGGSHLQHIIDINGMDEIYFIETPSSNSFNEIDRITKDILQTYYLGVKMFCFSTGYTTKILIDRLYPIMGKDAFMIDFGSCFDPYCGKLSRDGMVIKGFEYFQQFTNYKLC